MFYEALQSDHRNDHFLTGVCELLDFLFADFLPFLFPLPARGSFPGLAEENRHTDDKNRSRESTQDSLTLTLFIC